MKTVVDCHRHFTGTLPAWFICAEARRRHGEPQVAQAVRKLVGDHHLLTPEGLRAACKRIIVQKEPAYSAFFELYALIQAMTKPSEEDYDNFYFRAGRAIAAQANRERIRINLIMGAHLDIDLLVRRVKSTVRGATYDSATTPMRIRVTFIRTAGGAYKNLSSGLIDSLFAHLERDRELERHVVGLDFCGMEYPHKPQAILDALEQIYSHNQHRSSRRRLRLDVSVHAGEDLVHSSANDQLAFLEELCAKPYGPQTIAHGTILWISPDDAGLDAEQQRRREACLRTMASRKIGLEICPTANLRMTPLASRGGIPVGDLARSGVCVRIGSDSPVLLSTTIRREILHIRRSR